MPESNENNKYAPTSWGGAVEAYKDLTVPTGQICQVRRTDVQGLMKAGVLHEIDPFMGMIQEHENRVQGKAAKGEDEAAFAKELLSDPAKMESVFHLMDKVVCYAVVQPEVHMTPEDITRREQGKIYADMIDLEDKIFIMNYALGGSADVATFREGLSATVERLESESNDGGTTE